MAISYTEEQRQVIEVRDCNVLVSAAAGSGKTSVLVERILSIITDSTNPVDIDRLLIVTFTGAAAAQMRERIFDAISDRLEQTPEDAHLQKQAALVHTAQITTIDSFCLFLIRNHFQEIGLDPGFRVADEGEINLLKQDTLVEVLESCYKEAAPDFLHTVECYANKGKDKNLETHILTLYNFAMSYPFPKEWLYACKEDFACASMEDMHNTGWMTLAVEYIKASLKEAVTYLQQADIYVNQPDGPYIYGPLIEAELANLEKILSIDSYGQFYEALPLLTFDRLPVKKDESVSPEKRELAKEFRNKAKDTIGTVKEQFFFVSPEQTLADLNAGGRAAAALIDVTVAFMDGFAGKKREKNLIDFSDMEHFALQILLEDKKPSKTARAYQEYFKEVMIDEYQDSNLVQELLLKSVSGEDNGVYNRFMVGDMKQSIYKFRLARPELFMEKFDTYTPENFQQKRIDLHKNFRSRKEVIESVNYIFAAIMDKAIGGVSYDDKAALNLGASYPEPDGDNRTELLLFESKDGEMESNLPAKQAEAMVIAKRIRELVGAFPITDKATGTMRPARYQDVVILLRTGAGWDEEFKEILMQQGIPVHVSAGTGYFSAMEIQTLLDFLRVIDNPYQDIPLAGVLRSPLFAFTDEELAWIHGKYKEGRSFLYECLTAADTVKAVAFLSCLKDYREKSKYLSIHQLVYSILRDFSYLEYVTAMPGGQQRKANVEMFIEKAIAFEQSSFRGLFHFIRYMEQLKKYNVDFGEAGTIDENADVVRIMTIHKSKGLEFPICFVSGMAKQFNMRDVRKSLILDIDMGMGMEYIDPVRRIKSKTVRKNVVARKMLIDSLGEELRILYVAMTRAKEKLIMTGVSEDVEKLLKPYLQLRYENGKDMLPDTLSDTVSGTLPSTLPYSLLVNARSFLQYVIAALSTHNTLLCNASEPTMLLQIYHETDLLSTGWREQISREVLLERLAQFPLETQINSAWEKELQEKFSYIYPHEILSRLYTKTSVSELKKDAMHKDEETQVIFETDLIEMPYLPKFINDKEKGSATARGNAYHKVMELLDYKEYISLSDKKVVEQKISSDLQIYVKTERLTGEYAKMVRTDKVADFILSICGQRMCTAAANGKLYKETPFVISLPANKVKAEFPEDETILIQGIIDVYFEENKELVILDYKTDRINSLDELSARYKAQLDYYEEALQQLTQKNVKEKIMYSFGLSGEVRWK